MTGAARTICMNKTLMPALLSVFKRLGWIIQRPSAPQTA
jgi:hypothetical protein